MVRSIRLLAAAALAAGLAAAAPAANAQTQDEGAVQTTGPLGATPQKAKPRQTALKKRAQASRSGRQADHGACPAVLADRRHAGSRRHGRQRLRLQHVQPADADLRAPSWACAAGRGLPTGSATPGQA